MSGLDIDWHTRIRYWRVLGLFSLINKLFDSTVPTRITVTLGNTGGIEGLVNTIRVIALGIVGITIFGGCLRAIFNPGIRRVFITDVVDGDGSLSAWHATLRTACTSVSLCIIRSTKGLPLNSAAPRVARM